MALTEVETITDTRRKKSIRTLHNSRVILSSTLAYQPFKNSNRISIDEADITNINKKINYQPVNFGNSSQYEELSSNNKKKHPYFEYTCSQNFDNQNIGENKENIQSNFVRTVYNKTLTNFNESEINPDIQKSKPFFNISNLLNANYTPKFDYYSSQSTFSSEGYGDKRLKEINLDSTNTISSAASTTSDLLTTLPKDEYYMKENLENKCAKEELWKDLDEEDSDEPIMVSEYANDIFDYLYGLQYKTLPLKHAMHQNLNIRQNRDILVNWLIKVHFKFALLPETLYLAINLMDRFLTKKVVSLDKLQLVGTSALFLASKYEEIYSPSITAFAIETDGACTVEDIKSSEKYMLKILDFNLNYPNPMNFLRRISKADDYHIETRSIAKFLLEITMVDFHFVGQLPSALAAASMFLARKLYKRGPWDETLIHYSGGYKKEDLKPLVEHLINYINGPVIHPELIRKYKAKRYDKASVTTIKWIKEATMAGCDIIDLYEL